MSEEHDEHQVDPDELRKELLRLARVIQQLDAEDALLDAAPQLLKMMGNLRSQLFDYEVRCTGRLLPKSEELPEVAEAQRIVEEAVKRQEEAEGEWGHGWPPEAGDDEEDD